jgi:carbon monoxide dehydrogenase subunit G
MEMTGAFRLAAPRESVWAALNDPEVLRRAIPGCDSLSRVSPTEFKAQVTARIGPVKASFAGMVALSEADPPNGYTISGEGSGGAAGFAKGAAKVRLEADGAATILSYAVEASVGGKLAQIGGRLIEAAAHKLAEEFFQRLAAIVVLEVAPEIAPPPPPEAPPPAPPGLALAIPAAVLLVILLLLYRAARL